MSEKTIGQDMMGKLSYSKKNVFESASAEKIQQIFEYSKGYMKFLDNAKTEREATETSIEMLTAAGFTEYKFGDSISVGDKKYFNQHSKSLIAFKVGENDIEKVLLSNHHHQPRLQYSF